MTWQRILSEAPRVDSCDGVTYYEVGCRTLLNQVQSRSLPFDLSLNPYLNCELGCTYCYARDFSRRRQGGEGSFDREVYAKRNAPSVLRRQLERLRRKGELG